MKGWRPRRKSSAPHHPVLPGIMESHESSGPKRASPPHEQALERARARLFFVLLMFIITFGVIAGRMIELTLSAETGETQVLQAAPGGTTAAMRADITDRNGTILATSLPTVSLCADARNVIDADEAITKLRTVLPELDRKFLGREFQGTKRCAVIKRHLTPRQYYEINKLGIAGIEFLPDESRVYPLGNLTAHVVGYTDIDNNGIAGMEKSLDDLLSRRPEPAALSLDLRLQTIMHRELTEAVKEYKAEGAAGIILDIGTGEILALVSLPDFDPHRPGQADEKAKFNRATLGVYEMGSTFKIFTVAMALDSGLIKPSDRFDTVNPIQSGGKTIRDFHRSDHAFNVAEIFKESSNIGAARMAEKLGTARMRAFFARLGLTEKAKSVLPETGAPLVPPVTGWSNLTTMTAAFGHGIAVTALQLAAAAASIVNDGIPVKPTLLKVRESQIQTEKKDRIISQRTSAQMRALMRIVVTDGTAKSADVPGYLVGGKTGTADKIVAGRYNNNSRLSSFIGVFPIDSPRYLVFAMIDDPKGNAKTHGYATGGWTAAPVVAKVIGQIGPLLNIPPCEPEAAEAAENKLLQTLGAQTLSVLRLYSGKEDYASVESNKPE